MTYYCHIQLVRGYPSWVGGRGHDFYPGGSAFGYLPNPFGGPPQNLGWSGYDFVFAQGHGRSATGVPLGNYLQWATHYRISNLDELADPDSDGQSNILEFLRDTHPEDSLRVTNCLAHFVEVDGARHFAFTAAMPATSEYASITDGSLRATLGTALHVSAASGDLKSLNEGQLRLVEVSPPIVTGLPALSAFHRYRTFRLSEPVSSVPAAFIGSYVSLNATE